MRRKLIRQGKSALTVTLPSSWTEKNLLKQGDEVSIEEGNSLKIAANDLKEKEPLSAFIDVSNTLPLVKNIIGAYYIAGYDSIKVKYSSSAELKQIQEDASQYIGFNITVEAENEVHFNEIAVMNLEQAEGIIRRVFFYLLDVADETLKALSEKDVEKSKVLALRDRELNKLVDFCRRAAIKYPEYFSSRSQTMYAIMVQLEKIGDCYKEMNEQIASFDSEEIRKVLPYLESINKFIRLFNELFFDFKMTKLKGFAESKSQLDKQLDSLLSIKLTKNGLKLMIILSRLASLVYDLKGSLLVQKVN